MHIDGQQVNSAHIKSAHSQSAHIKSAQEQTAQKYSAELMESTQVGSSSSVRLVQIVHSALYSVHSALLLQCTQVVGGCRECTVRWLVATGRAASGALLLLTAAAVSYCSLLSSTAAVRKHCCLLYFAAIRFLVETNVWSA